MTAPTLPIVREPVLEIRVYGTPAPQGSKRHVGNGVMVESSAKVKPWREAVKAAALDLLPGQAETGPVGVTVTFFLARPKGHWLPANSRRDVPALRPDAPRWPSTKPDLDKLIRSTLDAIKDAGVYADDSQVVNITASKIYAGQITGPPGAIVIVRSME